MGAREMSQRRTTGCFQGDTLVLLQSNRSMGICISLMNSARADTNITAGSARDRRLISRRLSILSIRHVTQADGDFPFVISFVTDSAAPAQACRADECHAEQRQLTDARRLSALDARRALFEGPLLHNNTVTRQKRRMRSNTDRIRC